MKSRQRRLILNVIIGAVLTGALVMGVVQITRLLDEWVSAVTWAF